MLFQIVIALGIVIITAMVIASVRYNKKRVERLKNYALMKGGRFSVRDEIVKEKVKCFHHPKETVSVKNVVNIQQGPLDIHLFDYYIGTSAHGRQTRLMSTACLLQNSQLRLENSLEVWTKIPGLSRLFGGKNQIAQPGTEEFNKTYLVLSPDPSFARKILNQEMQELFMEHKRTKDWMLIFKLAGNKILVTSNMLHLKTNKDWDDIIELGMNLWEKISSLS